MIRIPDIRAYEHELIKRSESYLMHQGAKRAHVLFQKAAELVPAYRDFLKKNGVQPHRIGTEKDFSHIPPTNKENYIHVYPLEQRCWKGVFPHTGIMAASSGTSGTPNYWLRGSEQEREAVFFHEFIYRFLLGAGKGKTLVIIGFPLGVYVSGVATILPTWALAESYRLTVVSAGTNKADIVRILSTYGSLYEMIIIAGHPFFVKDVIEASIAENALSSSLSRIALLLCSEGFSESWRLYVKKMLTSYTSDIRIISMYGSSEFLIMAHETDDSITMKQKLEEEHTHYSVFQYHPFFRHFETERDEFLCTAGGAAPLIRHTVHDAGTLMTEEEAINLLGGQTPRWHLPFLLLRGRNDQTLVFYAANIYPEHVRQALDHPQFHNKITGKFSLQKKQLPSMDQQFEIIIECQPRISASVSLRNAIRQQVMSHLLAVNKEYLFISQHLEQDVRPHIILRPYQDPEYFQPGTKPRYIRQTP